MNNARLAYLRCLRRGSKIGIVCVFIFLMQFTQMLTATFLPLVQSESVSQQVSRFSGDDRWLAVTLGDSSQLGKQDKAAQALAGLAQLTSEQPLHFVAYRPVSDKGSSRYQLVGADKLTTQISLRSGRLPDACTESRCEVLLINAKLSPQLPNNFTVTGTASLTSSSPIWSALDKESPLIVAEGAASVALLPDFLGFPATEVWAAPLRDQTISAVGLTEFLETANTVSNQLSIVTGRLKLVAPFGQLEAIQTQADVLQRRLASLGLAVCALATFAIYVLGRSGRSRHQKFLISAQRLQSERFSGPRTTAYMALIFTAIATTVAYVACWPVLLLVGVTSGPRLVPDTQLTVAVVSAFMIFAALQSKRWSRNLLLFATAALWATQAVIHRLDTELGVLALVAAVGALLLGKAFSRSRTNPWVVSAQRASGQWVTALSMSSAFIATLLLASQGLLTSFQLGALDNAIYNSPTETRIKRGGEATVMELNTKADYQRITNSRNVFPVQKISASVREGALKTTPTLLVGVDPQVWTFVPDIRHQTSFDLRKSRDLLPDAGLTLGVDASGARELEVRAVGLHVNTYLSVWVLNNRQESELVSLTGRGTSFRGQLPLDADQILGFEITEFPDFKDRREHAVGEGINGLPVPTGEITVDSLSLDGVSVKTREISERAYSLINGPVLLSLVEAPAMIPAIVDSETADFAAGKELWINIGVDTAVALKVVGSSNNLPTVPMRFAMVNPSVLIQVLAAAHPEMIRVSEIWSTGKPTKGAATLKSLDGLAILGQEEVLLQNHTTTSVRWTERGFGLLWFALFIMYIVIATFAAHSILTDRQVLGWHAAGVSLRQLTRRLAAFLISHVLVAAIVAAVLVKFAMPLIIALQEFDLNGEISYPGLVLRWNWIQILTSGAGMLIIVVLALHFARRQVRTLGRGEL